MAKPGEYGGISEAMTDVQSKPSYKSPDRILAGVSGEQVSKWTESLTGFEAGATVSKEDQENFENLNFLYNQSRSRLEVYAAEMGVSTLNEFSPEAVLFMVCFRDKQKQHTGKENLNTHKFSVLRGGRYSVK